MYDREAPMHARLQSSMKVAPPTNLSVTATINITWRILPTP
jgi:hypothetical protein